MNKRPLRIAEISARISDARASLSSIFRRPLHRGFYIPALAASFAAADLGAQQMIKPSKCDLRLWQMHRENPVDYQHFATMPRIVWDITYAASSVAIAKTIEHVTPFSPQTSAWIPTIGIGLGPHTAGLIKHMYKPSIHMAFTFSNMSLPLAIAQGQKENKKNSHEKEKVENPESPENKENAGNTENVKNTNAGVVKVNRGGGISRKEALIAYAVINAALIACDR